MDSIVQHIKVKEFNFVMGISRKLVLTYFLSLVSIVTVMAFYPVGKPNSYAVFFGYLAIANCLVPLIYVLPKIKDGFALLFNAITLFNISPIWFLHLENVLPGYDAYEYVEADARVLAIAWTMFFMMLVNGLYVWWGGQLTKSSVSSYKFLKDIRFKPSFFLNFTLISFILIIVAFYFHYGSLQEEWRAFTEGRTNGGGSGILKVNEKGEANFMLQPLTWIWQLIPLFGTIAYIENKKTNSVMATLALVCSILVVFIAFLSGSRGNMMSTLAPMIYFLFYFNWNRGIGFWIFIGGMFFIVIGVMELQVRFRGNLLEVLEDPERAAQQKGLKSATTFDATESHRDNNMYLFSLMVRDVPSKYPYEGYNDFFAMLFNPVPRALWPDKPVLRGAMDLNAQPEFIDRGPVYMGTTSLSYSIVGESYLLGGFWAVVMYAVIYTLILLLLGGLSFLKSNSVLVIGLSALTVFIGFWSFRSFFAFVMIVYPFVFIMLMLRIFFYKRSGVRVPE